MNLPPPSRPGPRSREIAMLGMFTLLALGVAGYAVIAYAPGLFDIAGEEAAPLPNARLHPRLLFLHVATGAVALLAGTAQVLSLWRAARPTRWHRRIGIAYVTAVTVSGVSGLLLAPSAAGGTTGRGGFALLAFLWLATTVSGVQRMVRGDLAGHRRAMVRSFALTAAAISLRLQLPLALAIGFEFEQAYPWIAWSCWVPNLIFAETWLRRR